MSACRLLTCCCLIGLVRCSLTPRSPATVRILSPRKYAVLHTDTVQIIYRVEGAKVEESARMFVNRSMMLETHTTQPSVTLAGMAPGVCELTVKVEDKDGKTVAEDTTWFLISSAAVEGRGAGGGEAWEEGRKNLVIPWPAVAFGSDDWGRIADTIPIFPRQEDLERTEKGGWDPGAWGRATVEQASDLYRLFDMVEGINEGCREEQKLVLSPYFVVGGPDHKRMRAMGCPDGESCSYAENLLHNTTGAPSSWPYCRGDLRRLYRSGFEQGVWHPQYHGRSHFDVRAWVKYLREDETCRKFFEQGMVFCNDTEEEEEGRGGQLRSLLSEHVREHAIPGVSENDPEVINSWMEEGLSSFLRFWGFPPLVAAMPHHACLSSSGDFLFERGFLGLDNSHLGPPLLSSLRVGFEPCCLPLSVSRARELVRWTVEEQDGLVNVQVHAQNFHSSSSNGTEVMRRIREVVELVLWMRRRYPRMVFVTESELMQLRAGGFSREVWGDRVVYRNHNEEEEVKLRIDLHSELYTPPRVLAREEARRKMEGGAGQEGAEEGEEKEEEARRKKPWLVFVRRIQYGTGRRESNEEEAAGGGRRIFEGLQISL
ncbi:hypothetical protein GUITHDRAFT_112206 [Guillardia theta CCMP2712]|uniref:Uncharacterized protein n=2 Tax=Guillardia theta TaxID=55529 RepID=L1J0H5_GUITC|nr:hypothetical protein GUITHDRAFT_112206 [Guillardia theta CCMP2712]EKX41787.1 hypothetical protein GUITHDRAFT_112206 [Guillardia theta CCMP2712]|eukprot:XP_005828767.1 hypothetical protein GUITHDRAFT_112206 [Guillardia theta CCMP2712]